MDETDAASAAAEAQSSCSENESDPDLDLYPPASPVGNTFWCQCGECFARDRRQDCVCCFDYVERVEKVDSLSVERLHVDLQLSRSTCHCLHAFSFSYLFWTALRDFFDMTKHPLSVSPATSEWKSFVFRHLRVDGSFIHHCLYFFYKFSQFRAAIEVAEQPPNKRRRNSSFLVNRWKLTPSFRCLSYLLQPKAQQKTVQFSVAVQLGWLCHARNPLDRRARSKALELSTRGKADTESGRVLPNLPHVRNSESRFTSACLPRSRLLCDRRPTSASRKLEICATRLQSTNRWTASRGVKKAKFNLFLGQLPRQMSSSNLYQTRVIR